MATSQKTDPHGLTPRQRRFVQEYLVNPNATTAAEKAGFSSKTAASQGSRMLRNVKVRKALTEGQEKQVQRLELTADEVIGGLRGEANFRGKESSHSARVSAWKHLGDHLKLFVQQVDHKHSGQVGISIIDPYAMPKGPGDA